MKFIVRKLTVLFLLVSLLLPTNFAVATITNTHSTSLAAASSHQFTITDGSQSGLEPTLGLSISCWVNAASLPASGSQFRIVYKFSSVTGGYAFQLSNEGGTRKLRYFFAQLAAPDDSYGYTAFTPTTGTWYQVGWRVTALTNTVALNINGTSQSVTQDSTQSTVISGSTETFRIGSDNSTYFDGKIDECLFYSTDIGATAMANLYSDPCNPSTTNLVSEWRFDNNGNDSQGSNNLTNVNSATFTTDRPFTCGGTAPPDDGLILFE